MRRNRKKRKPVVRIIIISFVLLIGFLSGHNIISQEKVQSVTSSILEGSIDTVSGIVKTTKNVIENTKDAVGLKESTVKQNSVPEGKKQGLELPAFKDGYQYYEHTGWCGQYDRSLHNPLWIAYELTVSELNDKVTGRTDNFIDDPSVLGCATLEDYRRSGYDRGHIVPSADLTWSVKANEESFYMSNMSPQIHRYNAGLHLKAEDAVRDAARMYKSLYVCTGPVLTDGPFETIGNNKVAVPHYFYKALLAIDDSGKAHAIGLLTPQEYQNGNLKPYVCTIDHLEEVTGLDFFVNLDDVTENEVEAKYNLNDWTKTFRQ